MLKTIRSPNKPAFSRNNGSKSALSRNDNSRPVSERNNGNSEIGFGSDSVEYVKKSRKLKAYFLEKESRDI